MNDVKEKMTFEEALEGLKRCVKRLDDGGLTLEEMVSTFEDGAEMARICRARLEMAKGRVLKVEERAGEITEVEADIEVNDK